MNPETLRIQLSPEGFLSASNRNVGNDPTHYDAVWVRDSVWGYYGLYYQNRADAKRILLGLCHYFATQSQTDRLERMEVIHIRFDGKTLEDVFINGKPQVWNHKQNDALGIFDLALCHALKNRVIEPVELPDPFLRNWLRWPYYFEAIRYYQMEDAGSWEEIERLNSSSIALVTSGLKERTFLSPEIKNYFSKYNPPSDSWISDLYHKGRRALFEQFHEGESPHYDPSSPQYRTSDAALLNLIFPIDNLDLSKSDYLAIFRLVDPLVGKVGIRRYLGDAYQSAGYWDAPMQGDDPRTDDHSCIEGFEARKKKFIPGSEAQWFFDSWYSICFGKYFQLTGENWAHQKQLEHLERSIAQITPADPIPGADGVLVAPLALPESYNVVVTNEGFRYLPSPITPLNWAKASLELALRAYQRNVF